MTRQRSLLICLLTATFVGVGFAGFGVQRLQAQAQPKAQKTAVAVVNVAGLIAKADKNIAFQEDMQKRRAKLQQEAEAKQKAINTMQVELDVLPATARAAKEREIIEALSEFQAWQQIQQQYMLRDQRAFLIELYGEIDKTVATVAKSDGFEMVILDTPSPDFSQLNPEQLVQVIGNRRVIFREDRVDLTDRVLAQMNLNHQNRGNN